MHFDAGTPYYIMQAVNSLKRCRVQEIRVSGESLHPQSHCTVLSFPSALYLCCLSFTERIDLSITTTTSPINSDGTQSDL